MTQGQAATDGLEIMREILTHTKTSIDAGHADFDLVGFIRAKMDTDAELARKFECLIGITKLAAQITAAETMLRRIVG